VRIDAVPEARSARLKRIRIVAMVLTALSLLILLVSANIRLSGAGLGCSPWPDCYGQLLAGVANLHSGTARILHRSVASLALVLGFVLVAQSLRPYPIQPAARYATALLALMILLTFVGLFSSDPHRVWAGFINMLGGIGLVLLSWRTVLAAGADPAQSPPRPALLVHAGAGLLVVTIALGAQINPFTSIAAAAGLGDDGGVALHLLHRYCALATLLLLGLGGVQALAQPATRSSAILLLVLLLTQFTLGVLTVLSGFSLWLAIAHGLTAALLLATTLQLLVRPAG
jgi:cytochrome c oxidase assembly protein subunit 15